MWNVAGARHFLGVAQRLAGDYDTARDLYLESVALGDELGSEARKQQDPKLEGRNMSMVLGPK